MSTYLECGSPSQYGINAGYTANPSLAPKSVVLSDRIPFDHAIADILKVSERAISGNIAMVTASDINIRRS